MIGKSKIVVLRCVLLVGLAHTMIGCGDAAPAGTGAAPVATPAPHAGLQLGDTVVRRIFQDSRGTMWFGTNSKGVVRYANGKAEFFSIEEGFGGWAVRAIAEDAAGNVWFGTSGGVTRHDGTGFVNFTETSGLPSADVWSLTIARDGTIWVGTLEGVCRFANGVFTAFHLPPSTPDPTRGVTSARICHDIMEDSKGRMWFASNDGAYVHDGESLRLLSERDGLCSNSVNGFLEHTDGSIWFATHHNGVCRWDGTTFTHFGEQQGITGTEAWKLYHDRSGNLWFPIEHAGVYRYDGSTFTRYHVEQGLRCNAVQCVYEDRDGLMWFGGWMTLYSYDGKTFVSHTQ